MKDVGVETLLVCVFVFLSRIDIICVRVSTYTHRDMHMRTQVPSCYSAFMSAYQTVAFFKQ